MTELTIQLAEIERDLAQAEKAGEAPILCGDIEFLVAEIKRLEKSNSKLYNALASILDNGTITEPLAATARAALREAK